MSVRFIPLGPPVGKKPRPKPIKFLNNLYGYISCEDELVHPTELYAVTADDTFELVETGSYPLEDGTVIEVVDGVIIQ